MGTDGMVMPPASLLAGMTVRELEAMRRDLATTVGLAAPGSAVSIAAERQVAQIDAELASRAGNQ